MESGHETPVLQNESRILSQFKAFAEFLGAKCTYSRTVSIGHSLPDTGRAGSGGSVIGSVIAS
jgi:hypothetical protein